MIVLITGDSRGIGYETAKRLYEKGYEVIGISRSKREFPWYTLEGDVSKLETWEKVRNFIKQKFGRLDVFIHNAGIHEKKKIDSLKIEEFEYVMKVNLFSAFYGIKYLYDLIPKSINSSIILVSSIVAYLGSGTGGLAYVSSKAGLIGLGRQLAKELKPIRVNIIAPGYINTSMISHWDENRKKEFMKKVLVGRLGEPKDVAEVIEFLIKAKYINGEVIHVNGGYYFGN